MFKYCALLSLCAGLSLAAPAFQTGMGARLVIGQVNFTQQDPGATASLIGGAGGLAVAGNTLFVADSNRTSFTPNNNRVLLFNNLDQFIPSPTKPFEPYSGRCPVCLGTANVVLGQPDFTTVDPGLKADALNLPTGVASDGQHLVVADTSNNRVLIWNSIPTNNQTPADIVLGQADFTSRRPVVVDNKSLRAPQGVWLQNGKLFVADTQNYRVLIWNSIPTRNDTPADIVLGQPNFTTVIEPDLTKNVGESSAKSLLTPVSVTSDGVHLFVADLGNNRVLIWNAIPTQSEQPADVVIGQQDFATSIANDSEHMCDSNGTDTDGNATYPARCAATLDFPRFVLSDGTRLFIADGGNDRVLIFNTIPTDSKARADVILGQPDEFSSVVTSYTDLFHPLLRQSAADITTTPTSLAWDGENLYVADPSNRRILVFTPGEPLVPINGVRNAASREIYAIGAVTITGTVTADNTITVTINDRDYKYTLVKDDTIETILANVTALINAGDGDADVYAQVIQSLGLVELIARKGGEDGNNITLAAVTSDNATVVATASGATLANGQNAAIIAPGTLVSFLGSNLADQTASADATKALPVDLGGVEVYFDGIRAPLLFVSPDQINAQVPYEVLDANSISAYVRVVRNDGTVQATAAVAVPIAQQNPGLFAEEGTDPRPGIAYHSSSYASGAILIDGLITPGDRVTISVEDRQYAYVVQQGDTLNTVRDAFIALINANPEEKIVASAASAFSRIRVHAKIAGPEGNNITLSTASSDGATVVITITNPTLCCANVAGSRVTPENPARPGEAITFYATGLGIVGPQSAISATVTGQVYNGPALNDPRASVSAMVNNATANVLSAGLKPGTIGLYEVVLELGGGTTPNPLAQVHISQDIYTSNVVTIPVSDPNASTP